MIGTHRTAIYPSALVEYVANGKREQLLNAACVRYHSTVVAAISDNNGRRVLLDTGGWKTATTKKRMNQALEAYGVPYYVAQRAYAWHVYSRETDEQIGTFERDAILIRPDGTIVQVGA